MFFRNILHVVSRLLPLPGLYPESFSCSPYYEVVYLIQAYAQIVIGAGCASADMFFVSIVLITAEQFDILGKRRVFRN